MKCYDPEDARKIPALVTLAKQYANCDRWFSSVPGPTLPNRAFLHAATSIGRVDMNPIWRNVTNTVYELLDANNVTSTIYVTDFSVALTFKNFANKQSKWFATYDDFLYDCKHGTLPAYSVVEPRYNDCEAGSGHCGACDQHPDHDIREGDRLIWNVYDAIRQNTALWESTLLVVMYDEHGGTYDHVVPPSTVNPDGKIATDVSDNIITNPPIPPFDFTRLGLRVPALIISLWIEPGTIDHTVYDHTSVIATAHKLFLGDQWQNKFLTERDRNAATFDHLLTRSTPRTDMPERPEPETSFGFDEVAEIPPLNCLDKELTRHQKDLVDQAFDMEQDLPLERRSGITSTEHIQTERQASEYIRLVAAEILGPRQRVAGQ
jgi:phospholipase C